jgi:hypothetical protein
MPSGMTYDMTVTLGMDFPSLDKYFDDMLEKMGEDAAAVVHVALPLATGITVRMEYLDRRAGVEQKAYDFPEDDQPRHAFILIKPGHFDMLYAKEKKKEEEEIVVAPVASVAVAVAVAGEVKEPAKDLAKKKKKKTKKVVVEEEKEEVEAGAEGDVNAGSVRSPGYLTWAAMPLWGF